MGWLAFNFECETPERREALVQWFEANHDVERKHPESGLVPDGKDDGEASDDDADAEDAEAGDTGQYPPGIDAEGHQEPEIAADVVLSDGGETVEGEMAWVGSYLYLTVPEDPGPLLEQSASHWDRAVKAQLETRKGGCRLAILYTTIGSHAIEVARHQGKPGNAAMDVTYVFAMAHQFRFRAYADILPEICTIPFPSAFHAPDETDPESERFRKMAELTGVEPTPEGLTFIQRDPMRVEAVRPSLGPRERAATVLRSRIVRPVRAALLALRARF